MLKEAQAAIANRLEPIRTEGIARVTASPVGQGPIGKGEVQVFYQGSRFNPPQFEGVNRRIQQRTITCRVNLLLKDLRDEATALDLVEKAEGLLRGFQPLGPQEEALYEGALYLVDDRFTQLNEEAFWLYTIEMAFQVIEVLSEPGA